VAAGSVTAGSVVEPAGSVGLSEGR
jgi:hypothetical protein